MFYSVIIALFNYHCKNHPVDNSKKQKKTLFKGFLYRDES